MRVYHNSFRPSIDYNTIKHFELHLIFFSYGKMPFLNTNYISKASIILKKINIFNNLQTPKISFPPQNHYYAPNNTQYQWKAKSNPFRNIQFN